MSVDYSAKIVIGLPFYDVFESVEEFDDLNYGIHGSTQLEICSPHYDAPLKRSLVGVVLVSSGDYSYREIQKDFTAGATCKLFKEITGKEPKVYLTVHGY